MKSFKFFLILICTFSVSSYANFIENKGQLKNTNKTNANEIVAYTFNSPSNIFIHKNGTISFVLVKNDNKLSKKDILDAKYQLNDQKTNYFRVDMQFIGNNIPTIVFEDKLESYNHFYCDSDKYEFIYDHKTVVLKNLYNSIDLKITTIDGATKYDFIVNPGANYKDIKYVVNSSNQTFINEDGSLVIKTQLGDFVDIKPVSFQENNKIETEFVIKDNVISYQLSKFDTSKTIIIDPIIWSTFLGGNDTDQSLGIDNEKVILNPRSNIISSFDYITGLTTSINFPYTLGSFATSSFVSGFVSKYDDANGRKIYTIIFSRSNSPCSFNDIVICGTNRPAKDNYYAFAHLNTKKIIVCGSIRTYINQPQVDGLISSFEADTGVLNYSQTKQGCSLNKISKVSYSGNSLDKVYITGSAFNNFLTTIDAFQRNYGGGANDACLLKVSVSNGATLYSTFFGGSGNDIGFSTHVYKHPSSNIERVIIVGRTNSQNNIAHNAYQSNLSGDYDGFIANFTFSINGSNVSNDSYLTRNWSTYLGGRFAESINDIEIDIEGGNSYSNAAFHIVGLTSSTDFPVRGSGIFQSNFSHTLQVPGSDGFFGAFNLISGQPIYLSYLGTSSSDDEIYALRTYRFDRNFYIELVGATDSSNFYTTPGAYRNTQQGIDDGFITVLKSTNITGTSTFSLFYSTYFGSINGGYEEELVDIAKSTFQQEGFNSEVGSICFTGSSSADYPLRGSYQSFSGGIHDAVVTKFAYNNNNIHKYISSEDNSNDNILEQNKPYIYPNPTNDFVFLSNLDTADIIKIYDLNGKLVREINSFEKTMTVDLKEISPNIYFIIIERKNQIFTIKLINQ